MIRSLDISYYSFNSYAWSGRNRYGGKPYYPSPPIVLVNYSSSLLSTVVSGVGVQGPVNCRFGSRYEINELNEKSPCLRAGESGCNTSSLPFAIRLQCPEIVYGNHLQADMLSDG